ncbi:hypothetical protein BDP27DRAFT_1427995 [Rhodocollybia butyracea]|uniref:Uncharacterized protein n=1 Tax=Rhodocollybia butyracea TaxID=206335 RepID=A0A9P5PEG4_9AGAR|nr:hypothetical protein BDP27DRAFT_1427995 [Rhodocollybia butyracea]
MLSHQEMDTVSNTVKQLFRQLSRIDPPDSNASPGIKDSFKITDEEGNPPIWVYQHENGVSFLSILRFPDQLHSDDLGQEAQSDNESDKLEKEGTKKERESLPPKFQVEDKLERIFDSAKNSSNLVCRYTLDNYFKMVLRGGHSGKVVEEEREAYRRMIIGYEHYSSLEISTTFEHYNVTHSSVSCTTANVFENGKITDPVTRLQRRETLIFRGPSEDVIASYLLAVIRNIEGFKAYEDWSNLSTQSRNEFFLSFACSLLANDFDFIDNLDTPQKEKTNRYTALIMPIRKKHNKVMEQRKRFQDLYFRFGPIVLLDPTFMKTGGTKEYSRLHKFSLPVFRGVIRSVDGPDPGQTRYNEDRRFVTRVLQVLGGGNISKYDKDFLMENCYWVWDEESDSEETEE